MKAAIEETESPALTLDVPVEVLNGAEVVLQLKAEDFEYDELTNVRGDMGDDEEIRNLAATTNTKERGGTGQIQPVIVRPGGKDGKFRLVVGRRRARAAILNRMPVLAVVRDLSDEEAYRWALIENLHRRDFNPIALAANFRKIQKDHGWTGTDWIAKVAAYLGVSRA